MTKVRRNKKIKLFTMSDIRQLLHNIAKADYRHYICAGFTVIFLLLAALVFRHAPLRIWEALRDIWTSLVFYVSEVFDLGLDAEPSVLEFTSQPFVMPFNLPNTWDEFKVLWSRYWEAFILLENVQAYFALIGDILYYTAKVLTILMPFIFLFIFILNKDTKTNNDYNKDSKPLKRFKRAERRLIFPVYFWCRDFVRFIKENSTYAKIWALIWSYNFNFITVIIEICAYYLYLITSFDLITLYIQVLKLLMDMSVMINFIPGIVWLVLGLAVFNYYRRKIGFATLNHMERCDRGFINERPIVIMVCGTMGKKKTTMITDIALSQEIMFRDKAFEKILECDLKFPAFPWIIFENELKRAMSRHSVYNLATARRFVKSKAWRFYKAPGMKNIFTYNYEKYGMYYDDNLTRVNLWEVLEIYAQLYFVYVIQSSLLISNYSIRTDNVLEDLGNFPLWNSDLFRKDSRMMDAYSRHAHIIDFDALRLGKKLIKENERSDSFEFGVINITEIGKERGNNLELQQVKKNDENTNQKNDLFNSWLKMVRHSATIDNFPFVKVITDEQRPESWGADARDLCEIVHIDECSGMKLSMPFFALEELAIDFFLGKFENKYYNHRFERGDNTLKIYFLHILAFFLMRYKKRVYNQFGYYKLKLNVEQGTGEGGIKAAAYYLMCKKIYSKRFSTDCFSEFFNEKALRSKIGIDDLPEFEKEKASFEEMLSENSYFFNDLTKLR